MSVVTRIESLDVSCAAIHRASHSPYSSSGHRDGDCRKCNLETDSGALCRRCVVEGKHSGRSLRSLRRVWHVEDMAHVRCRMDLGARGAMVRVWITD